jgi:glycosyltransferase involved in cell wall biosynthesis
MKKVLFISHSSSVKAGGAERVLLDVLGNLDRTRIQPVLLCPKITAWSEFNTLRGNVSVYETDFGQLTYSSKLMGAFSVLARSVILAQKICRIIKHENIDLIYANTLIAAFFSLVPSLLLKKRIIYHEHGLPILRKSSLWNKCFPLVAKRASKIIAISEAVKHALEKEGVDGKKIATVYNGIEFKNIKTDCSFDIRKEFNILPDEKIVGKIAHMLSWKGHMILLRAIPLVLKNFPCVKFIFIGGERSGQEKIYFNGLKSYVKKAGIERNVIFAGFRKNALEIMNGFDILVHASDAEPFGLIFLEAMILEKPVVASNSGAAPEIIIEGENGLLFEQGNHHELAKCILTLIKDTERCLRMGIRGKEIVQTKFTLEKQVEKIQALL